MERINRLLRLGEIMGLAAILAMVLWPLLHYSVSPEFRESVALFCMVLFFMGLTGYSATHIFIVPMTLDKIGISLYSYKKGELAGKEYYIYSQVGLNKFWIVPR